MVHRAAEAMSRPRIEGNREKEVLEAAIAVLAEVGYDRLTMDAVAARAKASKATLYRRWRSKSALVIEAMCQQKAPEHAADTGDLRSDLIETYVGPGGLSDPHTLGLVGGLITAIGCDPDFGESFREDFLAPKAAIMEKIFDRARERGELRPDLDTDLLSMALPGIVLTRLFLLGEEPSAELLTRVIDEIILPAVRA